MCLSDRQVSIYRRGVSCLGRVVLMKAMSMRYPHLDQRGPTKNHILKMKRSVGVNM